MSKTLTFYYDVVCPYAFMASRAIESLAARTGATVQWRPVLLGGIYKAASTIPASASATDIMAPSRRTIAASDLVRQMDRAGFQLKMPPNHPVKTLNAQRLLAGSSDTVRPALTHKLFTAYWLEGHNIADTAVLSAATGLAAEKVAGLVAAEESKSTLTRWTEEAVAHGAFGVPSFVVNGELFWGADRMFMVERALGGDAHPVRLQRGPGTRSPPPKVNFYFDYSSPYAYLASTQIEKTVAAAHPAATLVWTPILLGALFKTIGTPVVPMSAASPARRAWGARDLDKWAEYWRVPLRFPSAFPLRTVAPLRVTLACPQPRLIHALFRAAWQEDKNIGDEAVLREVVAAAGYNADVLMAQAGSERIKEQLRHNTDTAAAVGLCGVPSYQVDGGEVVWGQDRLNVLADMLAAPAQGKL